MRTLLILFSIICLQGCTVFRAPLFGNYPATAKQITAITGMWENQQQDGFILISNKYDTPIATWINDKGEMTQAQFLLTSYNGRLYINLDMKSLRAVDSYIRSRHDLGWPGTGYFVIMAEYENDQLKIDVPEILGNDVFDTLEAAGKIRHTILRKWLFISKGWGMIDIVGMTDAEIDAMRSKDGPEFTTYHRLVPALPKP